ncbi:MAG TPA: hypothetical protein VGG99_17780 [Acetobacteraceae bacterium]|jgi:prephenate dehydrogenase
MWRDILLNKRKTLVKMLARFIEDSQAMAHAVHRVDAAYIEDRHTSTTTWTRGEQSSTI